ncbi:MAG: hypothetical protein CVU46_11095, partial [Chloroflexi bacterium HGW-Chloroflexi-8]
MTISVGKIASMFIEIGATSDPAKRELDKFSKDLNSYGNKMMVTGTKLTLGITVPALLAAKGIFGVGAALEQSKVAFTTMLGSAQKAGDYLNELRDFAKATPFEFMELQDAARRMMAFGFESERVIPMLTDIGDATAGLGLGSDGINRITLALGQMQAKGKVSAQEMMQLTEAGIPAWRYLADAMGLTTAEVMKMSEQGLIPAGNAIDYILAGMEKNFGGLMAEQAKTALGQLSALKDELNALGADLSDVILPIAKDLIGVARETVQAFGDLSPEVQKGIISLVGMAAAAGPMMTGLGGIMKLGGGLVSGLGTASKVVQGLGSGLSLTGSLGTVGFTALAGAATLAATAIASAVAIGVAWNEFIVKTNKEGAENVDNTWTDFFNKQVESGASAIEIANEYTAAQERMRDAMTMHATTDASGA